MKYLDLTLPSPAQNLALDEALLESAEDGGGPEVLRFWESPTVFAVLGFSRKASEDLRLDACQKDGIPVMRRASGGGTVLQGPGCLNFALVLRIGRAEELGTIQGTNTWVLNKMSEALRSDVPGAAQKGISDLAVDGKKFSGTAQRRKRSHVLFHGTLLHGMDLRPIETYIAHPAAKDEPDYRAGRRHGDFITCLNVSPVRLKKLVRQAWNSDGVLDPVPLAGTEELVRTRYSLPDWNLKY